MKSYVLEVPGKTHNCNEDSHYISHFQIDNKPAGLFIIADGCSGHNGTNASHYAVKTIGFNLEEELICSQEKTRESDHLQKLILDIIDKTNNNLHDHSLGRTTIDLLIVMDNAYHLAHLGDSQIYTLEGNNLNLLTIDESAHGEPTNYLGRKLIGEKSLSERITIQSYHHLPAVFLLATDGLTSRVAYTEIKTIIDKYQNDDPTLILPALVDIIKYPFEKIKTMSPSLLKEIAKNNPQIEPDSPDFIDTIIADYKSMRYPSLNNQLDNILPFDDATLIYIDFQDHFSSFKTQIAKLTQELAELSEKYEVSKTLINQLTAKNSDYNQEIDSAADLLIHFYSEMVKATKNLPFKK
ncbi:protein phosphatase 2C domain-containing protein [Candidatus Woesearchaeota archaeon]|nr:protein phosphatase 2C domain-containing protein [Candidatus Woesearchaeota archaeon]